MNAKITIAVLCGATLLFASPSKASYSVERDWTVSIRGEPYGIQYLKPGSTIFDEGFYLVWGSGIDGAHSMSEFSFFSIVVIVLLAAVGSVISIMKLRGDPQRQISPESTSHGGP